jgi:hypothetical protein
MSEDLTALLLGKVDKLGLDVARLTTDRAKLEAKLDRVLAAVGITESDDEFADIDLERVYTAAELAGLPGRECSTTAIYAAMDRGRLQETLGAGVRSAKGRAYIAFLRERKGTRRGSRSAKAKAK